MSTVNEASSLFGGADSGGSDPFDSIVGSPSLDAHTNAQDPISDLFGNAPGSDSNDAFASLHSEPAAPALSQYAPPTQPNTHNGEHSPYAYTGVRKVYNSNMYRLSDSCASAERVCSTCCTCLRTASCSQLHGAVDVRPAGILVSV